MEIFRLRISNSASESAAYYGNSLCRVKLGLVSERSYNVDYIFTCVKRGKKLRRCTDSLEYKSNASLFSVKIGNGKRNTLSFFMGANYNELSGAYFRADRRSLFMATLNLHYMITHSRIFFKRFSINLKKCIIFLR